MVINKERIKFIEANVERLQKLRDDTRALYNNGFVEKIDLDRVDLALNNLLIEKEKIIRLFDLAESLLKFQMGYDINSPIVLTDTLAFPEADFSLLNDKFGTRD